jgi:hypothetical protein
MLPHKTVFLGTRHLIASGRQLKVHLDLTRIMQSIQTWLGPSQRSALVEPYCPAISKRSNPGVWKPSSATYSCHR